MDFLTHFERSDFLESPDYDETMKYFKQFETTGKAEMFTFGLSPQGRELKFMVVGNGDFSPQAARANGKAVVLIQNGIHAGEIEGKDASMLLLREILVTGERADLLQNCVLVVIPILNVDGHERASPFNRPNQNGPVNMGWRTTSWNLNLNRDYMKADTPEMKALLQLYASWQPDFFIDNHTTNGADYQYHITYGIETHQNIDNGLAGWAKRELMPHVIHSVEGEGFLTGPYLEMRGENISEGITDWPLLPRYSTGYAAAHNRLLLLVETHSLKPFANRVFSTKAMNASALEFINTHHSELTKLNYFADANTVHDYVHEHKPFPLVIGGTNVFSMFRFKGYESIEVASAITGSIVPKYSGTATEFEIPLYDRSEIEIEVEVPFAYIIPREFTHLIETIKLHGIEVKTTNEPEPVAVERYRFTRVEFASHPYEGRQRVMCGIDKFVESVILPEGTFVVYAQQRTLRVIMHLLEPQSPDSFVSWGFFNAFFERKEYAEPYIMEPIAKKMLEEEPGLREEFEEKLANDETFANDPGLRLNFFYEHSAYHDKAERVYPIMRLPHKEQPR